MIVEFPFCYTASGRFGADRRVSEANLIGTVPIRLRILSEAQAPVIARCTWAGLRLGLDGEHLLPVDATLQTDYRSFDGHLMRRVIPDAQFLCVSAAEWFMADPALVPRPGSPLDAYAHAAARGHADGIKASEIAVAMQFLALGIQVTRPRNGGGALPSFPTMSQVPSRFFQERAVNGNHVRASNRAARSSQAAAAMIQGAAIIGDALYLPSFGPGWVASHDGIEAVPEMGVLETGDAVNSYDASDLVLAANVQPDRRVVGGIETLPGWLSPVAEDEVCLRALACQYRTLLTGRISKSNSPGFFRAWATVVEAASGQMQDATPLAAAITAMGDAMPELCDGHVPGQFEEKASDIEARFAGRAALRQAQGWSGARAP